MTSIADKGGMVTGPSHKKGGVKFIVENRLIEAEGGEPVIPGEIMDDNFEYEFTGTNLEILDQINEKFGARDMEHKAKVIDAGDVIICKISASDKEVRTYKGTLTQIVSQINQSGGCKPIDNMHTNEEPCECTHAQMEQGGLVKKLEKGDRLVVNRWEDLPESYRLVKKVNDAAFVMSPYDKSLLKIIEPFTSDDYLRPERSGIHFNEYGCVATDAHKLIFIPGKTEYRGTYCTTKSCVNIRGKAFLSSSYDANFKDDLVTINYPEYARVFASESGFIYPLDVLKLKTYCESVINAHLSNKTTKQIFAKVDDFEMGFNAEFLIELCTSLMMLGHRNVWASFCAPNRAMIVSPDKSALEKPVQSINTNSIMALIMPVMATGYSKDEECAALGSCDLDFERYAHYYFDFSTNEIRNQDGDVALFDENLTIASDRVVNADQFDLLKLVIKKAVTSTLPILEYVDIKNGVAHATSLEAEAIIHGVNGIDGMYLPMNGDLLIEPSANLQEAVMPIQTVGRNRIGTFSRSELLFHLSIAAKCVGKDEMRPFLSGINIKNDNGKIIIEATDAHIAYRNEMVNADIEPRNSILFGNADILIKALKISDTEVVEVFANDSNVWFNMHNITVAIRKIDARFPNVEGVFPAVYTDSIVFDADKVRKCLAGVTKTERKAGLVNIVLASEKPDTMSVIAALYDTKYLKEKSTPAAHRELCEVPTEKGEQADGKFGLLVMPVMEGANGLIIAYNLDILEHVLDLIPDLKITIEYSAPNRATRLSGEHAKNFWHPENLGPHIQKLERKQKKIPATASHNKAFIDRKEFAEMEFEILKSMMPAQKQVAAEGGVACM